MMSHCFWGENGIRDDLNIYIEFAFQVFDLLRFCKCQTADDNNEYP